MELIFIPTELPIGGFQSDYEESRFVVMGVPYEETSTYRKGSNKAPSVIRNAAANLETMNMFSVKDLAFSYIHDKGDLTCDDRESVFSKLEEEMVKLKTDGKIPVLLGGEHTISVVSSKVYKNSLFLVFDAHMDLRDKYNNDPWSHACTVRRMLDNVEPEQVVLFGTRAFSPEEYQYAMSQRLKIFMTPRNYQKFEDEFMEHINSLLPSYEGIYISIDMDGFDPAFVPGVGNPEPMGISPLNLLSTLSKLDDIVGIDITELSPSCDPSGVSDTVAARTAMCLMSL